MKIKTAEEILAEVFDCDTTERTELQFFVTLNPSIERIKQAMETYASQFKSEWVSVDVIPELNKEYLGLHKQRKREVITFEEIEGMICLCTNVSYSLVGDSDFSHYCELTLPTPPTK